MDQAHSQRATVALRKLAEVDPAYMSLSLWCKHRDTDGHAALSVSEDEDGELKVEETKVEFAPAYTDGSTIYYGTKFASWTLDEQVGVCAHEISHVAFRHVNRAKKMRERMGDVFDMKLMNIATDAIINQTLLLAGYTLPRPCIVLTDLFKEVWGETITAEDGIQEYDSEKLYIRLSEERKKQGKKSQKGPGKGKGSPGGKGEGSPGEGDGEGDDAADSKSAAERAKEYADGKGFAEDMDAAGKSRPEDAQADSEWQQRLTRAMNQGRLAGKGVGKLGHLIADLPKSKVPWEVILRRLVTKAVTRSPRMAYDRPTRRWLGMDADAIMRGIPTPAYEPGIVKQSGNPRIAIGVDVSGSISDNILKIFASEIATIGKKTGAEIHLFVFDDGVLSEQKLAGVDFESEVKRIEFARGGGTSFVEVIERAQAVDPSIIVVLTDLYGPFGKAPGAIPVIWASPEDNPPDAPFGRVLKLNQ